MPEVFTHRSELSTEFAVFQTLFEEQNVHSSQYTLPVNTIRHLRDYLQAPEAILVLFDAENPDWASRKLLGAEPDWKSESAILIRDSILCNPVPEKVRSVDYGSTSGQEFDPSLYRDVAVPIRSVILSPLRGNGANLGMIVFINPLFDIRDQQAYSFLGLITGGIASAIQSAERIRQLVISKADLEATYWQIVNSRNTLRTFFDNIPSSVYIVDRANTIIAVNNHRSARVNKRPQDLVGKKCYETLCGNPAQCSDCRILDGFNGIPSVRTLSEVGPKETFVHWEITTVPIRGDDHTVDRVIVFEEDVTEKWILEANLIQSEKMASIGQLAANVAHEINNPLAAIIANAQLLIRDLSGADDGILDSLRLIETAGDRAAKIVSNLLESARREKHHEFEEISLNETVLDAISLLRYEINKRGVSVDLDLAQEIPDIFANKNQLKGVWINIINNALGAIQSKQGKIAIATRYENKQFHIVFSDNGKGILPEHQDYIFEPFFTTKEVGQGTGLGLSVSRQVIEEHQGDIQFETTPGKGTKFIITLPEIGPDEYSSS